MTAREAMERGIRDVKLPGWNRFAWLELPILPDGQHGPWAKLFDPISSCISIGIQYPTIIPMMWADSKATSSELDDRSDWEVFTGTKYTPDDIKAGKHVYDAVRGK